MAHLVKAKVEGEHANIANNSLGKGEQECDQNSQGNGCCNNGQFGHHYIKEFTDKMKSREVELQ